MALIPSFKRLRLDRTIGPSGPVGAATAKPVWTKPPANPPPAAPQGKVTPMAGERELTTGLLGKDASFRLIVSGNIGVKEIERLIK